MLLFARFEAGCRLAAVLGVGRRLDLVGNAVSKRSTNQINAPRTEDSVEARWPSITSPSCMGTPGQVRFNCLTHHHAIISCSHQVHAAATLHDVATPQTLKTWEKPHTLPCQTKTKMPSRTRRAYAIHSTDGNHYEILPNSVFLPAHPWRYDRATRRGCSCHAVHALRHTHAGKAGHGHRACECRRACCPSHKHGYRTCQLHHLEQQRIDLTGSSWFLG